MDALACGVLHKQHARPYQPLSFVLPFFDTTRRVIGMTMVTCGCQAASQELLCLGGRLGAMVSPRAPASHLSSPLPVAAPHRCGGGAPTTLVPGARIGEHEP